MGRNPFILEWPVDRHGYDIERVEGTGTSLLTSFSYDVIRAAGGPLRYYRPLEEHPDLWRRFANICLSAEGALSFVREFGLLSNRPEGDPGDIVKAAELMRQIAARLDDGDRAAAVELLRSQPPIVLEALFWDEQTFRADIRLVPIDLRSALLHQAAEAIEGNHQWRRCRNVGCCHWFRLGRGGVTLRREFCSDRCRAAFSRRHK
jgi:hypothetical protein